MGLRRTLLPFIRALLRDPFGTSRLAVLAFRCIPFTLNGLRLAGRALAVAYHVAPRLERALVSHLHAHFLHAPALCARLLADRLGASYSISAHARDIFVPELRFEATCRDARFIMVCSELGRESLERSISPGVARRIVLQPHGLDLARLPFSAPRPLDHSRDFRIISLARCVPKKGLDLVLEALAVAQSREVRFSYRLVGDGRLKEPLRALASDLGLSHIEFCGFQPHARALAHLAESDALIMGCRTDEDGDRDGIPNAVLEAMAFGVPVVTTAGGGVSEVVEHMETGLLIPSNDVDAMAQAIERLSADLSLRRRLAQNARTLIETRFDGRRSRERFLSLLAQPGAP
jgi:glycosyltransferase involved in cell wall biosynthesis